MKTLKFSVPGQPVGKGRPKFVRATGRSYTPEKTARYENLVALHFQQKYPSHVPTEQPVAMIMEAFFEIPRSWSKKKQAAALSGDLKVTKKPDTDNISKIKDALNGIAWKDDAQVYQEFIIKKFSDEPRLVITIMIED